MAKFKVGDKVVRKVEYPDSPLRAGDTGVVSYISQCGGSMSLEDRNYTYNPAYFELYKEPEVEKPTPHKHAEVIKAWADGVKIEFRTTLREEWRELRTSYPHWQEEFEYRVKPESKPDVVRYALVGANGGLSGNTTFKFKLDNLKLTFDGETGNLKAAEVI